ncbi:RNA interference gene silencing (Qde2) [Lecanosticta acicola]|uniref:RNA interference gene silencing (Qde2) n=1 Tax=Lecanosticta acicola TaxID=111012 RepID=A0AAI8YU80_9PEZI|nr:RNA interference gene silencing (Qde2) [Lecanosticta acicola]
MSGNQQRGRGGGRGGGDGGQRGGQRGGGGYRGGRGDSQARGGGGRGDFQGGRGGGGRGGRGGAPMQGQGAQLAFRGPPPGRGGIYMDSQQVPQPDANVRAAEDALVKHTRDQIIDGFPGRRGYGTKGKSIVLRTNYFTLTTAFEAKEREKTLYRYEVKHRQDLSKQKRRRVFDQIMRHEVFSTVNWATDYASILVTSAEIDVSKLMEGKDKNGWKDVTLPPEEISNGNGSSSGSSSGNGNGNGNGNGGNGQAPEFVREARQRNTFGFSVEYQGGHDLRQIIQYLQSRSAGAAFNGGADMVQMLNIILTKAPNEANAVANVGQNNFYPFHGHPGVEHYDLGAGLEALRGYFASVRPAVNRLLVNLNVTSGAFYKPMPLIQMMGEFNGSLDQREAFLRMLKVKARYIRDGETKPFMSKQKTIVGFAKELRPPTFRVKRFGNANEVKFQFEDRNVKPPKRKEISVFDYFRQHHGITLKRPENPVLNVGTRADPQYLPAELCEVFPGQAYRRLLSGDQTSEMLRFAARFPNLNAMSIAGTPSAPGNGLRLFRLADPSGNPQANSVQPWGFTVGTDMITVPGRILASPQISYGSKSIQPRGGSWNSADVKFSKPGKFNRWQVLVINRQGRNALQAPPEPLIGNFEGFLKNYGISMGQRGPTQTLNLDALTVPNRASNDRQLNATFAKAKENRVDIFLVIIPEQDKWLYARIKYFGDVEHGVHTICSIGSKISKPQGQGMYFGNLALKFNLKGGGVSHTVANTVTKPIDNNTMLVGIDVTHPSPGSSEGAPSIACVVASVDPQMFQWPGSIRTQTGRQEMVAALEDMVHERLDVWQKKNGRLPSKIVIYRDGVSEGQYSTVLENELPAFQKAFQKRYGAEQKWPKIAIIIVGKRHHTRFYPTRKEDADYNPQREKGSWNPQPGTVVDRGIANKVLREFWLQAHQGLQGTARPAHYVVIKDELSFEADEMEQFTHHLCYLFNRATKAVSICPPAYYADLLCERGRAYLFSTLAESQTSDSSAFDANTEWSGNVHPRLGQVTWYV